MRCFYLLFVVISMVLCAKDMMRKSIVFDKNTPDVFYCPTRKPTGFDKLIVKAKPLYKLCEFEGRPLPVDYKSDCYDNIDESDYACKEKYRIMMRIQPPGLEADPDFVPHSKPVNLTRLARFANVDRDMLTAKQDRSNVKVKKVTKRRKQLT